MESHQEQEYWTNRYNEQLTGWDIGYPSTPIKEYVDQLLKKDLKILIPGAGNAYEAEYLWNNGFRNVHVLDISDVPLQSLKMRVPDFPEERLLQKDFFTHTDQYDLIIEQTFFCSFEPSFKNRMAYANKMHDLLKTDGKLVGLWFNHILDSGSKRPYGGSKEEYLELLKPLFRTNTFTDCYNSIKPRSGKELFGIFFKKA